MTMAMFLVPKVDHVKVDSPRPLTDAEKARLRKEAGGDATAADFAKLAKFAKPRRIREVKVVKVVESNFFGNFSDSADGISDDDPDDDPATPNASAIPQAESAAA